MIRVNGAPTESICAYDRGLAYGDGVFRTLLAHDGEPMHWALQYAKLESDCAALGIVCPSEHALLHEARIVASEHARAAVKIIVTRGIGPRGYSPPPLASPVCVVSSAAYQRKNTDGVRAHLCRLRLSRQPALAGIKHLNRLENVVARAEWHDADVWEGLLLDADGWVVGGVMSNVFIVEGGVLLTPALTHCGVAGATRERVMGLMPCSVETLTLTRLENADEVFFTNSLIGVWPLIQLGQKHWMPGPITRSVRDAIG